MVLFLDGRHCTAAATDWVQHSDNAIVFAAENSAIFFNNVTFTENTIDPNVKCSRVMFPFVISGFAKIACASALDKVQSVSSPFCSPK